MPSNSTSTHGSRILWTIIAVMVMVPLVAAGGISLYRQAYPEPVSEQLTRAIDAYKGNEILIAHRLFKKLAANGNPTAEYWLADFREHGLATARSIPEAVKLLEKSAAQGFVPAKLRLGELYLGGIEIAPDEAKARAFLEQAAATGNAKAQRLIGQIYVAGIGVAPDDVMGLAYYLDSAAQGDRIAVAERDALLKRMSEQQVSQAKARAKELKLMK